jgi:hypothetical protein
VIVATVQQSIDVEVPVRTAYNQWTQFEEFPEFMDGVKEVRQKDDRHLHWVAEVGGKEEEWDAEITEQIPDERVAWKATSGHGNAGVVTFHRLDDRRTRVTVQMEHEPAGVIESVGAALGFDDRKVKSDLERFKQMIEARGAETGAWRGEVRHDTDTSQTGDTGRATDRGDTAGLGGASSGLGETAAGVGERAGLSGTGAAGDAGLGEADELRDPQYGTERRPHEPM